MRLTSMCEFFCGTPNANDDENDDDDDDVYFLILEIRTFTKINESRKSNFTPFTHFLVFDLIVEPPLSHTLHPPFRLFFLFANL